jgi:hypothetical protein
VIHEGLHPMRVDLRCSYDQSSIILCKLGTLAAESKEVIRVRVRAKRHGKKANAVKVTSDTYDPGPHNSATATTRVLRDRKHYGHHRN